VTVNQGGFGAAGWRMIAVSAFMYFAYAGWCVDGINIFSPALSAKNGWDEGRILTLVAPGGLMGVVGSAVFGELVIHRGPRWVMTLCLAAMAPVVFWFGRMNSLWEFALVFVLINFFAAGFGFIAPGTLLAHWFPRKKGMALAIATCGFPLATAAFVPLIALMFRMLGISGTTSLWSVLFLAASGVGWLVVRDTPEEIGAHPDNEPSAPHAAAHELLEYRSPYTIKRLMRDRDMWLISLGWGCLWMVTVGIVVQLVPRLQSMGYSQAQAIGLLSAAALCAVPGSVLWGYLDQRLGTRKASAIYGAMYIFTLNVLIVGPKSPAAVFLTVVLVGLGLGGIKSLITSMVATVYGRHDFSAAYRLVIPLSIVVRTACFPILGIALQRFGSLTAAYGAFIGVDIAALLLIFLTRGTVKDAVRFAKQPPFAPS
jgi:sugar phosphate permease